MSAPLAAVDIEGPVTDGFRTVATFVPKLLGFLVIVLIGYFVAKVVAAVLDKVLERVGFDRAVERGGVKKALAKSQYDASDIVAKIAFYFIFVAALSMAFGVLGIAALAVPMAALLTLLPKILVALLIVVIGAAVAAAAKKFIANVLGGLSYGNGVATAVSALVLVLFAKAALDEVGIATNVTNAVLYTALAMVAGVTIVGVGGGLIRPMQNRWEDILNKASQEKDNVKAQVRQQQSASPAYPSDPMAAPPSYAPPAGVDTTQRINPLR
ncbi:MAG: hypothetical protein QOE05_3494 [Actinomycetota bacterium]|jgi:hypothetical protein|nr:hypothetical protein [Actinomycetota bacterium]